MCILEGDVAVKYRRLTACEVLLTEPPQASLHVEEWTNEDEYASYRTYWELGGIFDDDYQNLDDMYAYVA